MRGFGGFVITVLFLIGKGSFCLLRFTLRATLCLFRNTSQFIQYRWKDVLFCFLISVILAHCFEKSQDLVNLLVHITILATSLVFTSWLISIWKVHQKRIKIQIRYAFRKGWYSKWYVHSKEYGNR